MTKIIDLKIEEKRFKKKGKDLSLLEHFDLEVKEGEKIAIVGESGVGKSTLLNIIGLLDMDYRGTYELFGTQVRSMRERERALWRNEKIGFILQESALVNTLTMEDNIKFPYLYCKKGKDHQRQRFEKIVEAIGIQSILKKRPYECSGGERSRAVFARGILMNPPLILADEPTVSLDASNREKLIRLLFDHNKEYNTTILMVTHDLEIAGRHDRLIRLDRG